MAAPTKSGIDYFPLDVDFLQDKKLKLIKGEFGARGVLVFIYVLCQIYNENGYFKKWDSDDCLLVSEDAGCGCTPELVGAVVEGCVKRGLFDENVFNVFSILTSAGIQRRYIRAKSTCDEIAFIKDFLLLDVDNKRDVPASIKTKLTLKKQSLQNNGINLQINSTDLQNNPQSKVNKSKVNKSTNAHIARTREDFTPKRGLELFSQYAPTLSAKLSADYQDRHLSEFINAVDDENDPLTEPRLIELLKRAEKSEWLTKKAKTKITMGWLIKNRRRVMDGEFDEVFGEEEKTNAKPKESVRSYGTHF